MPFTWTTDISPGSIITLTALTEIRTNLDYMKDHMGCTSDDVSEHTSNFGTYCPTVYFDAEHGH